MLEMTFFIGFFGLRGSDRAGQNPKDQGVVAVEALYLPEGSHFGKSLWRLVRGPWG
jgi:hypothetical protein